MALPKPATPKQIAFIRKLCKEQNRDIEQFLLDNGCSKEVGYPTPKTVVDLPHTSRKASELITLLMPIKTLDGPPVPATSSVIFQINWAPESLAPGCNSWESTLTIPGGTDYLKATVTQTRDDDQFQEYDIKVVYLEDPTAVEAFIAEDQLVIPTSQTSHLWNALACGTKVLTESVGSIPASVTA